MDATATLPLAAEGIGFPSATKALSRLLRLKPTFSHHGMHSPQRPALEAYVGQQFERAHDATVTEFLPELKGVTSIQLQGKRVILTGAAGGIGSILAELLNEREANCALIDAGAEALKKPTWVFPSLYLPG